jgi:hypothetical protein
VLPAGLAGPLNKGPHGFSEILYAFSSATANNGSAFAGLTAGTPFYNGLLGVAMWVGRFFVIVPVLAIAGSLAAKRKRPPPRVVPHHRWPVVGLLVGMILIVGGLTFLPGLALGPIADHLTLSAGQLSERNSNVHSQSPASHAQPAPGLFRPPSASCRARRCKLAPANWSATRCCSPRRWSPSCSPCCCWSGQRAVAAFRRN